MVARTHMRKAPILAPMSKSLSGILREISCTPMSFSMVRTIWCVQHGNFREIPSPDSKIFLPPRESMTIRGMLRSGTRSSMAGPARNNARARNRRECARYRNKDDEQQECYLCENKEAVRVAVEENVNARESDDGKKKSVEL